jgi:hypothetical protein
VKESTVTFFEMGGLQNSQISGKSFKFLNTKYINSKFEFFQSLIKFWKHSDR